MKHNRKGPVTSLKEDFERLESEAKKLKTDYLHSLAEFENFRKRKEREMCEFREFANEKLLCELVPILDNLERALKASETTGGDANPNEEGIRKGVKLIYQQLQEALGRFGFSGYSALGEQFDPRRCEAVGFVEMNDKPDGTVIAESARGYQCGKRVLRPAVVVVAKAKCRPQEGEASVEAQEKVPETPPEPDCVQAEAAAR